MPMRVPVLIILPAQEPLRASATAAIERLTPTDLSNVRRPRNVELDSTFHAIPLGTGRVEHTPSLAANAPDTSQQFAVRGFVEVNNLNEIPEASDGNKLFADPHIAPFLTCGGTPPVGTSADVEIKLNVSTLSGKNLDGAGVAIAIMDTGINLAHLSNKLGFAPNLDAQNSWIAPGTSTQPGTHPVNHGTMCAFDVLIAAPKATLLDFPILANSAPGGSFVGQTLSVALLGFAQLLAFWAVSFAPGGAPK